MTIVIINETAKSSKQVSKNFNTPNSNGIATAFGQASSIKTSIMQQIMKVIL